jgi:drug/metabolite transporter (DMT)-like permease
MSTDGRARGAVATLLVVGLLWSTAGALIKYVPWPPAAIWGLRSLIAAVALIAIYRPSWRGLTRTEWLSALALAATTGLFVLANKWTTAANAILIQYSAPAWAALFATLLLGERATRLDWFTIGLALIGVSLFFVGQLSLDHVRRQPGGAGRRRDVRAERGATSCCCARSRATPRAVAARSGP